MRINKVLCLAGIIVSVFALMPAKLYAYEKDLLPMKGVYELTAPVASRTYGVTYNDNESYAMAGYYGFTLAQNTNKPNTMTLKTYILDWDKESPVGDITMQKISNTKTGVEGSKNVIKQNVKVNESVTITVPNSDTWTVAWETKDCIVRGYVRCDANKAVAMRLNPIPQKTNGKAWENLKKNINMTVALYGEIHYPAESNKSKTKVHREKQIQELSDKIVSEKEKSLNRKLSDSEKIFLFVKYMQENYAYDEWAVKEDPEKIRCDILNDRTNPMNFTFDSHVGVCWDFASILNIMAKHHSIPAIGIMNDTHAISALYLDNDWVTFDIAAIVKKNCIEKDVSPSKWVKHKAYKWRNVIACDPDMKENFWITYDMWDNTKDEADARGF